MTFADTEPKHGAVQWHLQLFAVIFLFRKPLQTYPLMVPQNIGLRYVLCDAEGGTSPGNVAAP